MHVFVIAIWETIWTCFVLINILSAIHITGKMIQRCLVNISFFVCTMYIPINNKEIDPNKSYFGHIKGGDPAIDVEPWWRHQIEKISVLLALCAGMSPVTGKFPSQRPVTRSFEVYFDPYLNKRLSKQSRRWWFETPSFSLWHHCNVGHITVRYHGYWRRKTVRSSFKCWDFACLILETWRYICFPPVQD